MFEHIINAGAAKQRISDVIHLLQDGRPLFQRISGTFESETEQNFAAQGRPSWVPLSKATIAEREKRNKGSSVLKILQDRGILAASISSDYGPDFSLIGAGGAAGDYAAIQHLGGTIERAPYSTKVRLRTDAKGNLVRQGTEGRAKNLATFAKDGHKRVRESWHQVDAYKITIQPRPYLPFLGSGTSAELQPEAAQSVLDVVTRMLGDALG
jgi:phage virion morphogenesis protein